jgi:hypothetical protein
MIPQVFFRKLFSPQHHERWQNRQFTSFTPHGPPFGWHESAAAGSTNPADYPLDTAAGVSLPAARDLYIDRCAGHAEAWDGLDEGDQWTIQELAGVSAYDNPQGAFWYGGGADADDRFVAFFGVAMGPLPEGDGGGVVAAVIKPIGDPLTPEQFVATYCGGVGPPQAADGMQHVEAEPQLLEGDDIPGDTMPNLR